MRKKASRWNEIARSRISGAIYRLVPTKQRVYRIEKKVSTRRVSITEILAKFELNGKSKIAQDSREIIPEQDILRLQISVSNRRFALFQARERRRHIFVKKAQTIRHCRDHIQ
jgi:hypothetical protein